MFFMKGHFLSVRKNQAAAICKLHLAPAMLVDSNFCCNPLYKGDTATNHQVIRVESKKYNNAVKIVLLLLVINCCVIQGVFFGVSILIINVIILTTQKYIKP